MVPTMDNEMGGVPSTEIRNAIVGFVRNELTRPALLAFRFSPIGDTIMVTPNPRFADFNGNGRIDMYADGVRMSCDGYSEKVEYVNPKFFDQLERFINLLPMRLQ